MRVTCVLLDSGSDRQAASLQKAQGSRGAQLSVRPAGQGAAPSGADSRERLGPPRPHPRTRQGRPAAGVAPATEDGDGPPPRSPQHSASSLLRRVRARGGGLQPSRGRPRPGARERDALLLPALPRARRRGNPATCSVQCAVCSDAGPRCAAPPVRAHGPGASSPRPRRAPSGGAPGTPPATQRQALPRPCGRDPGTPCRGAREGRGEAGVGGADRRGGARRTGPGRQDAGPGEAKAGKQGGDGPGAGASSVHRWARGRAQRPAAPGTRREKALVKRWVAHAC